MNGGTTMGITCPNCKREMRKIKKRDWSSGEVKYKNGTYVGDIFYCSTCQADYVVSANGRTITRI